MAEQASLRTGLKSVLAAGRSRRAASGLTVLIYHRVGGGTADELDLAPEGLRAQLDVLARHRVVGLDEGLDELEAGNDDPKVALTFDDGFADVFRTAWPLLEERRLPFTVYVATSFVGGLLRWEGSTASAPPAPALTWDQLGELGGSGLCTFGNHTHRHVPASQLSAGEVDACSAALEANLGVVPRHFAYPWGHRVPAAEPWLRERFRSAATGELGRNRPGDDPLRLRRVPVRRTDPLAFFEAKLTGRLLPERVYGAAVAAAKRLPRSRAGGASPHRR